MWNSASSDPPGWLKYDFGSGNEKTIQRIRIQAAIAGNAAYAPKTFTIQASNDDTNWDILESYTSIDNWSSLEWRDFDFANSTAYRYYKIDVTECESNAYIGWTSTEMMEIAPDYTSDLATNPSNAIDNGHFSNRTAAGAFDNIHGEWNPNSWDAPRDGSDRWVGYDFGENKIINKIRIRNGNGGLPHYSIKDFHIDGWNGSSWELIQAETSLPPWSNDEWREFIIEAPQSFSKYRVFIDDTHHSASAKDSCISEIEMMGVISTDPLDNLQNGNTVSEIEAGLTNLTITDEASVDFAFDLATTDSSVTPSIDQISVSYEGIFNYAPLDPVLNNLNDGGFLADTTPTFSFNLVDTDLGASVRYQIQVDNNADFSSPEIDFTELTLVATPRLGATYTPTTGLPNDTFYWRVKAIDNEGLESNWTEATLGFSLDTNLPVSSILYPQD